MLRRGSTHDSSTTPRDRPGRCREPDIDLLGGRYNDTLRSYSYIYDWKLGEPPENAGEAALAILECGFTALKFGQIFPLFPVPRPISLAELNYARLAPWTYCGPISAAASMQLDVCSPNFLIQEGIEDWSGFPSEILRDPIEWRDGFVIPSTRPGLGYEIDERAAVEHPPHELSSKLLELGLRQFDEMGPAIAKYV